MSRFIKIELTDDAYRIASELAQDSGQPIEQWVASRVSSTLPSTAGNGSHPRPLSPGLAAFAGCVSIDDPTWSDNERIDRELAEEYGRTHEDDR